MGGNDLLSFVLASALLSLAPGPDNLFVLTQSALYGRRCGLIITLGLCSGLLVHTLAVALGVAAIFMLSATAFTLLKLLGAAYLLFLAWLAWRDGAAGNSPRSTVLTSGALYRRGILMNISNPKVAIFFLAFLPQFARPEQGAMGAQLMLLGGLFILVALLVFSLIAVAAGYLARHLQSVRVRRLMSRATALLFVALALRLATSSTVL